MNYSDVNKVKRLIELNEPISSDVIEDIARDIGLDLEPIQYVVDFVSKKPTKGASKHILNIDNKRSGGTHYVALVIIPGGTSLYFDSFGLPMPDILREIFEIPPVYNSIPIQNLKSNLCGLYCLHFLHNVNNLDDYYRYSRGVLLA